MTGRSSAKGPGIVGGEDYSACHWLMISGKATCVGVVGDEDSRDWAVQNDPGDEGDGVDAIAADVNEETRESKENLVDNGRFGNERGLSYPFAMAMSIEKH